MDELNTKKALVTGGSGGIGRAIVRKLCRSNYDVYYLDVKDISVGDDPEDVAGDVQRIGRKVFVECDLENLDVTKRLVEDLVSDVSGIDVLVNNAAFYPAKGMLEYTREEYQKVQTINVEAGVVCVNAIVPGMVKRGWGRIINISSITAFGKFSNLMPYVVSKGALISFTRALATELGEHGITANCVCPGAIPTDAEKVQGDLTEYNKVVMAQQALKRRGSTEEVADVVHFFASDSSSFVTGQTINVDGGWVMN